MARPIFLDHHSTTPVDPRVFEAMRPYFLEAFGNPHSVDHAYGWEAEAAVEAARASVARSIGARPAEIVFTSGATEANNLALLGTARSLPEGRRRVVVSAIEHACVAAAADVLAAQGFAVDRVAPGHDGVVRVADVAAAVTPATGLVSVMAANHEIGTLQPIAAIAEVVHAAGAFLHTDAAQAAGKVPLDVDALGVDLLSLSAHKMYGPKGVGALFVRRRADLAPAPLLAGGGQEKGLRSGTVPTPLVVGFGAAAALAGGLMEAEAVRLAGLRDRLLEQLAAAIPGLAVNGSLSARLPGNLNVALPEVAAVDLLYLVRDEVAVSSGSACASASLAPSAVLKAIGLADEAALGSIRIGLGRATTAAEIDRAAEAIGRAWRRLSGGAPRPP